MSIRRQVPAYPPQNISYRRGQHQDAFLDGLWPDFKHHLDRFSHAIDRIEWQHSAFVSLRFRSKLGRSVAQVLKIPPPCVAAPSDHIRLQPPANRGIHIHEPRARWREHPLISIDRE